MVVELLACDANDKLIVIGSVRLGANMALASFLDEWKKSKLMKSY